MHRAPGHIGLIFLLLAVPLLLVLLKSPRARRWNIAVASAGMIDLAKERAREREVANVHFARKTIFDEGLGRESYDLILAFNILHLLEDAQRAVHRASELLKPGGLMVSMTPCLGEARLVLRALLPLVSKVGILSYLRAFRISEVRDLMRNGVFQIVESEVLEGTIPSCFVVARKR